jgi:hypothetical protein
MQLKIKNMKKIILLLTFISFLSKVNAQIYVDRSATSGSNNGTSWTSAYNNLQDAIDAAVKDQEIWVAAGTYYPTKDHTGDTLPTDNRDKNFHLGTDMKIYGGFLGTETQLSVRDAVANITILSGDFSNDDVVTGGGRTLSIKDNTENAYHVMITSELTSEAVIDGFTIKGGNDDDYVSYQGGRFYRNNGGGMYNGSFSINDIVSSPTITNSTFANNNANDDGGGMYNDYATSPTITNSTFTNNNATSNGGGMYNDNESSAAITNSTFTNNNAKGVVGGGIYGDGGGMYNEFESSPTITNSTFTNNNATSNGGGMYNDSGTSAAITNSIFTNNKAVKDGGGMYNNVESLPTITNSTFTNNDAENDGGGMYSGYASSATITNVTFTNNNANRDGGGMYNGYESSAAITNSTFTNNNANHDGGGMYNDSGTSAAITNSTFTNNNAVNDGGGMYNGFESSAAITNSTFTNNNANGDGGGIYNLFDSSPTITNSIFWDNTKEDSTNIAGADIFNGEGPSGPGFIPKVTYCLTQENSTYSSGTGIINNQDPLFVDAATGDYRIKSCSPAFNTGTADTTGLDLGLVDLAGNARVFGGRIDMGALEYQGAPYDGTAIYVNKAAPGDNDGSSWTNAYTGLQNAIDNQCDSLAIWVAAGTYYPTASPDGTISESRDKAFHLHTDMRIYGGFVGGETLLSQRDWTTNVTILSGDIDNATDPDVVTGSDSTLSFSGNTGNAYHVLITTNLTDSTFIDGFTIKGGNADGGDTISYQAKEFFKISGGGMYNESSSPTITNVTFSNNKVTSNGGGMYNTEFSSPTITNSIFTNNNATSNGGGIYNFGACSPTIMNVTFSNNNADGGGGMYNSSSCLPMITNSTFMNNNADDGGGIHNYGGCSPTITNSTFTNNKATSNGGGIFNANGCSPMITHSTFTNNNADDGGGIHNYGGSSPTITNSTFTNNKATTNGGGMYNISGSSPTITNTTFMKNNAVQDGGGMYNKYGQSLTITNSIIWDNGSSEVVSSSEGDPPIFKNSIIKGSGGSEFWNTAYGIDNGSNLDTDPLFVDAANGDYTLQGCSPALNTGTIDTTGLNIGFTDLVGNARVFGTRIDMGALEYQGAPYDGTAIYVNKAAVGDNDGSSWTNAYTGLQDAIDNPCDSLAIWVAAGTYYPTASPDGTTSESRDKAFHLHTDMRIYGGFVGTDTLLSQRDWTTKSVFWNLNILH